MSGKKVVVAENRNSQEDITKGGEKKSKTLDKSASRSKKVPRNGQRFVTRPSSS